MDEQTIIFSIIATYLTITSLNYIVLGELKMITKVERIHLKQFILIHIPFFNILFLYLNAKELRKLKGIIK
jgi:hypothetical protein